MRKILLVIPLFLVLACNLTLVSRPPAPTASQGIQTPESSGPTVEAISPDTPAPAEIVPIPVSPTQIEGLPYSAYWIPGDPFRFVCQEPCRLDPQFIFAEYAGIRLAHAELIE